MPVDDSANYPFPLMTDHRPRLLLVKGTKASTDAIARLLGGEYEVMTIDAAVKNTDDKVLAAATRERMKAPGVGAARLRKEIGDTLTALDELPRTPLSSVVRVLEKSSAAIVIAPPRPPTAVGQGAARLGVTSIELSSIYPPKSDDGSMVQQIDLRA